MKYIFSIALFSLLLAACGGSDKKTDRMTDQPIINADSIGIAQTLHAFFNWYGETGEQLITKINFVNESDPHPVLDEAKLAEYLSVYKKSGTVSDKFVENEKKYYRACAELWKNEASGEMISGFDADRAYCQQDGDVKEFLSAPVTIKASGDYATAQLMLDPNGPNGGPRSFEMSKENGKWLLAKYDCQTGVEVK